MELLVMLALLCALGLLAARWGVDSRESHHSEEEELAALGLTWGSADPPVVRVPQLQAGLEPGVPAERLAADRPAAEMTWQPTGRGHQMRGQLARLLTGLANWLDPETARPAANGGPIGHPQSPS